MNMLRALAAIAAAMPAALQAQAVALPAAAAPLVIGEAGTATLRAGTSIPMRTSVSLTTEGKKLRVGERVPLEVAEPIRLNGQIVVPAGTPSMGEVTAVRNKGMWGKSGAISARVLYLRVGDRQVRLSGTFDDKGKTGTGGVVAAVAFIPVAGFFTTGTSARIPLNAPVTAFLDEDVPVAFASAPAAAPLIVSAPTASPPVANVIPVAARR